MSDVGPGPAAAVPNGVPAPEGGPAEAGGTDAARVFRDARPYGDPIDGAIATGDIAEMRRTAAFAQEWLDIAGAEVERVRDALARLRVAIGAAESAQPQAE